jgi:methylenetetrahydrofolate reductase (NADPH)
MKLSDKIAAYNSSHPFYTFEFFPPRTDQVRVWCFLIIRILQNLYQGFENLIPRISRLSTLNPLAISVTWGAGGSTRERSIDLAGLTQSDYGIDTILHLTCTNMVPGMVDDVLRVSCFPQISGPR